ncbi:MAG: CPBP family intramembrane metalloprotease [Deltaproteobacteria bacterium]|nr:CPBP family intramembrane metalloprotease [Deltaproteobacteria bacterium]
MSSAGAEAGGRGLYARGKRFLVEGVGDSFDGLDLGAFVIVAVGCAGLLLSRYHGTVGAYHRYFRGAFRDWPLEPVYDHVYWFAASFVCYGLLPFLVVVLLKSEKLSEYGLGLGDWRLGLKVSGFFFVIMVPLVLYFAQTDAFRLTYPLDRDAVRSWSHFWLYEPGYWFYFVAWEFLFRGYLLFGLHKRMGNHAIWVQLMPFVLMHTGKPEVEAFASIIAGVALCVLALRTRSFWWGAFLHAAVAGFMDLTCALARIKS